MSGSNVSIEQLAGEIERLTREYTDEVTDEVYDAVFDAADEAKAELRKTSPERTKRYKRGWYVRKTRGANFARAIVHNREYRLVHLLEKGHAKRGGGRVAAIPHVKPAEDAANERLVKRVTKAIGGP